MNASTRLSACVIARNEERTLERCLKSLAFADEIVVIDAGSHDRTVEIARRFTSKVIVHAWQGFARQRNVGLENCGGEWVFFLDADEEASAELGQRLKKIAFGNAAAHPNCYSIKRDEFFLGRQLRYGPGNPSFQWRFFKRNGVRFEGEVHEFPRFEGPIGLIADAAIAHWPSLGIDRFLVKLNHYTTLEALDRFAQGQRTTLFHATGTFFTTFLKNGIRYGGLWNGKEGFVLTLLESFSRVVRHLKLWVFWQVHEGRLKIDLGMRLPQPGSATPPAKAELERPVWKSE
ncbi:MAG: glycosyltransferase family 2 protein [Deltaproteobacteria bacterium]|nr:glycosyltransferase family 2 protein [Deltaproteobacteria bacterium]